MPQIQFLNVVFLLLGFVNLPIVFKDCVHESKTTTVIIVMTSSINDFFSHISYTCRLQEILPWNDCLCPCRNFSLHGNVVQYMMTWVSQLWLWSLFACFIIIIWL